MSTGYYNIKKAIDYAQSIVGTPYKWWQGEAILGEDCGPFWAANAPPPPLEVIRDQGVCCTGILNLILRHLGLPVPGVATKHAFAGGTGCWEEFLIPHLEPIDTTEQYHEGTILFRPYRNYEDQGHIGMILKDGKFLHSHATEASPSDGFQSPGCVIDETWMSSHGWTEKGYYMYAARWYSWLSPEDDIAKMYE